MEKCKICKDCGHIGVPSRETKGSLLIEIVLWCCYIIPGLIYSIWRLSTRGYTCPQCGSRAIIPTDSPVGEMLIKNHHSDKPNAVEAANLSAVQAAEDRWTGIAIIVVLILIALVIGKIAMAETCRGVPGDIVQAIKDDLDERYPGNYSIQLSLLQSQCAAYLELKNPQLSCPENIVNQVKESVSERYPGNYSIQLSLLKSQCESYLELQR